MAREDPQLKIRLPAALKDQVDSAAARSGRSMNAEIVARIEASFNAPVVDVWAEVGRIAAEESAASMFLSGLKQQFEEARRELDLATTSGAAEQVIKSRRALVDLLLPMQEKAFDEWFVLTGKLRDAKHRAMGIQPKGSPTDEVARRLFGPEWDDMPLPPRIAPPAVTPEPQPRTAEDLRRERDDPDAEVRSSRQVVDEFANDVKEGKLRAEDLLRAAGGPVAPQQPPSRPRRTNTKTKAK